MLLRPASTSTATVLLLALAAPSYTNVEKQSGRVQQYDAEETRGVVRLHDAGSDATVSIIPSAGNLTVEFRVRGHNVLRFPYESIADFKGTESVSMGIPFLGPWADRLDEQAFYANGRRFAFDMSLGNVRGANPIHGFLASASQWQVLEVKTDSQSAWVTSRLEFFKYPSWMKQFPFAHAVEMTHRLQSGVLEVSTRIENLSGEPMPVAIGFHPYFQLTDSAHDEWTISVGARTHWPVGENKMPTGQTQPIERFFDDPRSVALKGRDIDDVFSDLVRDEQGRAVMALNGKSQRLEVLLGPKYRAVVVYAPSNRDFVCLEPEAGIINALNLAHRGLYGELQSLPSGNIWQESFWVRPSGF
jgi:aldose 1-epimerase